MEMDKVLLCRCSRGQTEAKGVGIHESSIAAWAREEGLRDCLPLRNMQCCLWAPVT